MNQARESSRVRFGKLFVPAWTPKTRHRPFLWRANFAAPPVCDPGDFKRLDSHFSEGLSTDRTRDARGFSCSRSRDEPLMLPRAEKTIVCVLAIRPRFCESPEESHIEHAIGLVEDEHSQRAKLISLRR